MPAAAPTFSTITCWPRLWLRCGENTRAMTSNAPPAANGTTMVTGRVGQSCAMAGAVATSSAATAAMILIRGMGMTFTRMFTPRSRVRRGGDFCRCRGCRKIAIEPAAQEIPDARVALAEHEMIGAADEMQLGRLPGALEQLDRLLGGGDGIVGGMQQEQRTRGDAADQVVGAEVEHALRGLGRKRLNGFVGEIAAQMRRAPARRGQRAPHPPAR